jgi:hypothetical protein
LNHCSAKLIIGTASYFTFWREPDEESYVGYGLWENEEQMKNAMPQMIALLDSARHLLEELSPELGVTDPVSGTVVFEKQI